MMGGENSIPMGGDYWIPADTRATIVAQRGEYRVGREPQVDTATEMMTRARPTELTRLGDHAGANGIELDVSND